MKKIFILICFAVCFFGLVSAEPMNSSAENYIRNYLSSFNNYNTDSNVLNYVFESYDDYIEIVPNDSSDKHYFVFFANKTYSFYPKVAGSTNNNAPFQFVLSTYASNSTSGSYSLEQITYTDFPIAYNNSAKRTSSAVIYTSPTDNKFMVTQNRFTGVRYSSLFSPNCYSVTLTSYNSGNITNYGPISIYDNSFDSHESVLISSWNAGSSYQNTSSTLFSGTDSYVFDGSMYLYNLTPITLYNGPEYTEDSNLKLNIINNEYGEKELAIDFTAFMGASPAVAINAENLVLIVDNDGTEIVFDDLDSYIERFGIGMDQEVWAYIPLSVLVGSATDSKLVKVSFTESTSSPGGTYTEDHYISTNFWLKHEQYITPDIITPPATIYNDVKTSTQINNIINELNQKGSEYDIDNGKFSYYQTVPDYPDWADMYEFNVIFSRSGSDASLFDTWHRMNGSNYSPIDWATSTFNVRNFYENSSAWAYADVIVITVYSVIVTTDSQGFVASDYRFEGFLVWQTDRYYDHQSSFTLIDILNAFQKFANQQLENWDWLSDTFNDIQFNLFDVLNEMIRNDDFVLDWLKTINVNINKGFDSVVAAISNISFPVSGGISLDDLSDELQSLFIPQKTWADLGYDEYKDSLGVLALPFEFTFDSLDIIKDSSNYSPNFELHVNPLSVDIPDVDGSTKNFEVFVESDISMSPTSLFPASVWNTLQYFNLFTLVVVQALITYNHIFGGEER